MSEEVKKIERLMEQLEHPFYERVEVMRGEVKYEALEKAAEKYPNPFEPLEWTSLQLAKHALSENYDQGNYIVGLYEKCLEFEKQIQELHLEAQYWRLRAEKAEKKGNIPEMIKKPKYGDLDD